MKKIRQLHPGHVSRFVSLSRQPSLMPSIALACFGVLVGILLDIVELRIAGGAAPVLALGPLFVMLDKRLFPGLLFGPFFFVYLPHLLGYALGPLWQVHVLGQFSQIEAGFVPAQWGGALGLWSYALAFPLIFQAICKKLDGRKVEVDQGSDQARWMTFTLILMALAFFIIVFGLLSGSANRLGDKGQASIEQMTVTAAIPGIQYVMFCFLGYLAAHRRGKWFGLWLGTFILFGAFYFLDGGRGAVVFAALLSAMGFYWAGFSGRRVLLGLVVFGLFFIPMAGIVVDYRVQVAREKLITKTSFDQRLSTFYSTASRFTGELSLAKATETFFVNVTAHDVHWVFLLTPQTIPFAGFDGLSQVPSGLVPRIINPNKPNLLDGNKLAIYYSRGREIESGGSYMPAVGDGYRRFGWPGVALLYVFSAAVYAPVLAFGWVKRRRCEWLALFLFVTLSVQGVFSATLLSNMYILLWIFPKYIIFIWLIGKLSDKLNSFLNLSYLSAVNNNTYVSSTKKT